MLRKSLSFLAKADAAGIVLGARVPIILTSRAEFRPTSRLASCAVAVMIVAARRKAASGLLGCGGRQADASNGPCVSARRQRNATFHRKLALRGERVPAWLGQPSVSGYASPGFPAMARAFARRRGDGRAQREQGQVQDDASATSINGRPARRRNSFTGRRTTVI